MFDLESIREANYQPKSKNEKAALFFMDFVSLISKFSEDEEADFFILEQAAEKLFQAIELTPEDPELYSALAYVHYILGEENEAKKYMDFAISLAPKSKDIIDFARSMVLV